MNELLQKHGCANVFTIPEGLKELMSDISREVLREQPAKSYDFIANYLSVLLITREHGILAVRVLDDLCDCRPSVQEHLNEMGLTGEQTATIAAIIKEEIEGLETIEGKESIREAQIVKRVLTKVVLDEPKTAKVCQIARNAYRDYWYRKKLLEQTLKTTPEETWQIAAERTLQIYKSTKPSFSELSRATEKIQAAYRGYHVRRNLLDHLKPKKKRGPKVSRLGPPIDIAASREIDLGPLIDIQVPEDDVGIMFDEHAVANLGLPYDPQKAVTHVEDTAPDVMEEEQRGERSRAASRVTELGSTKSLMPPSEAPMSEAALKHRASRTPSVSQSTTAAGARARQSRIASIPPEPTPRHSRLPSRVPSGHMISFAEVPPEVIPDVSQSKSLTHESGEETDMSTEGQSQEGLEIPEEIPDDRTEADGESAPTTSVPDSAPETDATDVEDIAEEVTASEEEDR